MDWIANIHRMDRMAEVLRMDYLEEDLKYLHCLQRLWVLGQGLEALLEALLEDCCLDYNLHLEEEHRWVV
jgi:hypothetical protein